MIQDIIIFVDILLLIFFFRQNKKVLSYSILLSLLWVGLSNLYNYSDANYVYAGINLFAFFSWSVWLNVCYMVYHKYKKQFTKLQLYGLYVVVLFTVEYIGYNILKIQLASNYPGIFGLPLLHVPLFGQLYYLFVGVVFIYIINTFTWSRMDKK